MIYFAAVTVSLSKCAAAMASVSWVNDNCVTILKNQSWPDRCRPTVAAFSWYYATIIHCVAGSIGL